MNTNKKRALFILRLSFYLLLIIHIMLTNFTLYILDLITIFMLNRKAKYILRLMMSF